MKNNPDAEVFDQLDHLLTLLLLIPVIALGASHAVAVEALTLFKLKGELTRLGGFIAKKLLSLDGGDDPIVRMERLIAAHAILAQIAFFEALDKLLPALQRHLGCWLDG